MASARFDKKIDQVSVSMDENWNRGMSKHSLYFDKLQIKAILS